MYRWYFYVSHKCLTPLKNQEIHEKISNKKKNATTWNNRGTNIPGGKDFKKCIKLVGQVIHKHPHLLAEHFIRYPLPPVKINIHPRIYCEYEVYKNYRERVYLEPEATLIHAKSILILFINMGTWRAKNR